MFPINNFLEQTGSKDFPNKFKKYIYDGNEQSAERIFHPWTDKSTLSADIFNQAKELNRNLRKLTFNDDSEKRIKLIEEYLNNFSNRCEIISKNIKSVWIINYGPKAAQEFLTYFVDNFLYKVREIIRLQYIQQEQKFIEKVGAEKTSKQKAIVEEKKKVPLNKLREEIASTINKLSKINFHIDDPKSYLTDWLNLAAKSGEFYSKNNGRELFNKLNNINNLLIQVSQKLFNNKAKPEIVREAFDKDLKEIYNKINQESLNIDKSNYTEDIKNISKNLLALYGNILNKIKINFNPFLTQFSKIIESEPEKPKTELERNILKPGENFDNLRILLDKSNPQFFQNLSIESNKIIDKLNKLPDQYLIISKNYQDRKKTNANEQLTMEEKNKIYNLFTEIKREIVSLSNKLNKQQFKENTLEANLKKKFLRLVGTASNQFGYLGNLLEQILQQSGFKNIYEEIRRNTSAPIKK